ncbi:hypothetical protein [Geopseudomonas aromaticivorans]
MTTTLYHMTARDNLESILSNGLDPSFTQSSQTAIYLTDGRFTACNYTHMRPDREHVLLAIDVAELDRRLLEPDDYELRDVLEMMGEEDRQAMGMFSWKDASWQQSLALCSQVAYAGVIAPQAIQVVGAYHPNVSQEIVPLEPCEAFAAPSPGM